MVINSSPSDMSHNDEMVELEPCPAEEVSGEEPYQLHRWMRIGLLVLTYPWLLVFFIASQLDPYENGKDARLMGTHQQLGLPECSFKELTQLPCPSCGMTTSFCLLIRADVWNSLKANFAGTVLASLGLAFIPWALASAFLGRIVWIRSLEMVVFRLALFFLVVMFGRWGIILLLELTMKS